MTREEFIDGYCKRSDFPWEELKKYVDAIPCDCEDSGCRGWQMRSLALIAEDASKKEKQ